MERQPWRQEPFIYHMAQRVKMQTSLSCLISPSHLFSPRTDFLLILLLAKMTCQVTHCVLGFFPRGLMAVRALPMSLLHFMCPASGQNSC